MRIRFSLSLLLLIALSLANCTDTQTEPTTSNSPAPAQTTSPSASPTGSPSPSPQASATPGRGVLKATDGRSEITLPAGWIEDRALHGEAQIQASHPQKQLYVLVLSEAKADLVEIPTLERHSEVTRGILTGNLTNPQVTGPTQVIQINDQPATQYQITGTIRYETDGNVENINATYLHTTVETSDRYNQILVWTLPESFAANEAELQQMIASFKELE
jgi:hypothetical protein